jgi:plastocyanin
MLRRIAVLVGSLAVVLSAAPLAAGGGGCHGPLTDEEGTTVMMSQFCFAPMVVRVAEGDTVTWENMDSVDHNVVSTAMPGYGTATLHKGDSASVRFDDPGIYPYVCSIHPGMTGAVVVGDADTPPPAAVSAAATEGPTTVTELDAGLEQRIDRLEQLALGDSRLTAAAAPVGESSWPPLVIGLLGGLVIGALVLRGRSGS